jgi:hypothetical protein
MSCINTNNEFHKLSSLSHSQEDENILVPVEAKVHDIAVGTSVLCIDRVSRAYS